jgi:hypothetical protein
MAIGIYGRNFVYRPGIPNKTLMTEKTANSCVSFPFDRTISLSKPDPIALNMPLREVNFSHIKTNMWKGFRRLMTKE